MREPLSSYPKKAITGSPHRALWILKWLLVGVSLAAPGAMASGPRLVEDFETDQGTTRWFFSEGPEFPGARGGLERAVEAAHAGKFGGRLRFDFSGGGNYVAAVYRTDRPADIGAVRVWLKKPAGHTITFRYTDQTGQTFQKPILMLEDRWCDVLIGIEGFLLHWGGANDGTIHGPPIMISFAIDNTGSRIGSLLLDDLRFMEGKPDTAAGGESVELTAYRFEPAEGWSVRGGTSQSARLEGRTLHYDFSRDARSIEIVPPDRALLGTPLEMTVRARSHGGSHPLRMRLATHFMTFEKVLGAFPAEGEGVLSTSAPPGADWSFHSGENDGKIHGPLRVTGLELEQGPRANSGTLELLEIRVKARCSPQRHCVLTARTRASEQGKQFVATVQSMAPRPIAGRLSWALRDWDGATLSQIEQDVQIPSLGTTIESSIPVAPGNHAFLEAEATLVAGDELTPSAQAYDIAPPSLSEDSQRDPESPIGMGLYLGRYGGDPAGLAEMDRAARVAAQAGVKWSREDFAWRRIERRPGVYDFRYYDELVATARRHGISIYGLLMGWGPGVKPYSPEGLDAFCRWTAIVVDRYRRDVRHWEVWNEPNIFFWQGPKDLYAELLQRAHAAIKKANADALVLGCSTAGIDRKFVQRVLELGAPFDILTVHPYRTTLDDRVFVTDLKRAADLVRRPDGRRREVWITEMGWTTNVPHNSLTQDFQPVTQRRQAELLARTYLDAIASGVAPNISWYDFRDDGTDPTNFEHNLGIVSREFTPKPAYRALATMTQLLRGTRPADPPTLGPDVIAYRFQDAGGKRAVCAFWSLEAEQTVTFPSVGEAEEVDLMGARRRLKVASGSVRVHLRPLRPTFVVMDLRPK
jgi:hypothetical protein